MAKGSKTVKAGGKKKKRSWNIGSAVGNAMADFLMPENENSGIAVYRKKPKSVGKRVKAK